MGNTHSTSSELHVMCATMFCLPERVSCQCQPVTFFPENHFWCELAATGECSASQLVLLLLLLLCHFSCCLKKLRKCSWRFPVFISSLLPLALSFSLLSRPRFSFSSLSSPSFVLLHLPMIRNSNESNTKSLALLLFVSVNCILLL